MDLSGIIVETPGSARTITDSLAEPELEMNEFPAKPNLVLASSSPRRQQLMPWLGLPFTVVPSSVDESRFDSLPPADLAVTLAIAKAQAVASRFAQSTVVGADTVVELGGRSLGKPGDAEGALQMLRELAGQQHRVITGIAVHTEGRTSTSSMTTTVTMRTVSDEELRAYVATGEPMDKAGAYAVQGGAAKFVKSIEGCYLNVVGLPLCVLASLLVGKEGVLTGQGVKLCKAAAENVRSQEDLHL